MATRRADTTLSTAFPAAGPYCYTMGQHQILRGVKDSIDTNNNDGTRQILRNNEQSLEHIGMPLRPMTNECLAQRDISQRQVLQLDTIENIVQKNITAIGMTQKQLVNMCLVPGSVEDRQILQPSNQYLIQRNMLDIPQKHMTTNDCLIQREINVSQTQVVTLESLQDCSSIVQKNDDQVLATGLHKPTESPVSKRSVKQIGKKGYTGKGNRKTSRNVVAQPVIESSDAPEKAGHQSTDPNNNSDKTEETPLIRKSDKYSLRPRSIQKRLETEERGRMVAATKGSKRGSGVGSSGGGGSRLKQKPPPLSKYRRKTANARERDRMREINTAFETLRKAVPHLSDACTGNEKLTKITTLRLAMKYIAALSQALKTPEPELGHLLDLDCLLLGSDGESLALHSDLSENCLTPHSLADLDDTDLCHPCPPFTPPETRHPFTPSDSSHSFTPPELEDLFS